MFQSQALPTAPEVHIDVCVPGPRRMDDRPAVADRPVEDALARAWEAWASSPEAVEHWCDALATTEPGPALARTLAALAVPDAPDAVLLETLAGFERLMAWATSRRAVAVNELRRRRQAQGRGAFVGDEVAARLGTTRAAGERVVGEAMGLEQLPQVWDALDRGAIDARKASVLCDELLALPSTLRFDVAAELVPRAGDLTVPALRGRIRRRALAADPQAAARAHERERAARFVSLEPVRDGMAWLHAYLAAPDAVAVHTTLTALADAAPPDDPRGTDARRADALVDIVTRWLDAGTCPDGTPLPRRQRRRPHLEVAIAASTLAGEDDAPAELAGYGPITADVARRIARDATWSVVTVNPSTGEATSARRARRQGQSPGRPDEWSGQGTAPAGHGPGRGPTAPMEGSGQRPTQPGEEPGQDPTQPGEEPRQHPTQPGEEPRQHPTQPGEEPRQGSAPSGESPGRRASTPGYRPAAALVDEVLARDVTCTFPGCRVPATRCDLDHIEPFDRTRPAEDQTVATNLHALCRHHHNLKTHGGWQVRRDDATGRTTWTAPTGHTYVREPVPVVGGGRTPAGAGEATSSEEPPPF